MSEEVICGRCPDIYAPEEVLALLDDEAVTTLAELRRRRAPNGNEHRSRRLGRVVLGLPAKEQKRARPNPERLLDLRAYTFECPRGHLVDGSPGEPFGIGVIGASGASKSHMLPAIVREMDYLSRLREVGVRLSEPLYPSPELTQSVTEVFDLRRRLPATAPGEILGPYGCKLTVGRTARDPDARKYSLQLNDVAGEVLGAVSKIAEKARFITFSRGFLILVDPVDYLPTQFDEGPIAERQRLAAGHVIRNGVRAITDTLSELWEVASSRDLRIPICVVIAKADAVEWNGGFDWHGQTDAVIAAARRDGDLCGALLASSVATREAFDQLGGELVVDEIEESFDPAFVRWVAASATSTMPAQALGPADRDWVDDPQPCGVALGVLQVLDAAGVIPAETVSASGA